MRRIKIFVVHVLPRLPAGASPYSAAVSLVSRSYSHASRSTKSSRQCGPAICNPIGSPPCANPQGSEIAGSPHTLKGRVLRSNFSSAGRSASGFAFNSAIAGAGIGVVGVTSRSTSANTFRIPRRASSNSHRRKIYSAAETFSPVRILRKVSG